LLLRAPTFKEGEGKEGKRKERGKGKEWGGGEREWKGIGRVAGLSPPKVKFLVTSLQTTSLFATLVTLLSLEIRHEDYDHQKLLLITN